MKEKSIIQQNLKKIIGVIVVSVFAIITIYTVFRGSGISLNELTASLKEASWEGILLASEETVNREFGAYDTIRDNFPKYVVSLDEFDMSRNGIKHRNIRDFLLAEEWN